MEPTVPFWGSEMEPGTILKKRNGTGKEIFLADMKQEKPRPFLSGISRLLCTLAGIRYLFSQNLIFIDIITDILKQRVDTP